MHAFAQDAFERAQRSLHRTYPPPPCSAELCPSTGPCKYWSKRKEGQRDRAGERRRGREALIRVRRRGWACSVLTSCTVCTTYPHDPGSSGPWQHTTSPGAGEASFTLLVELGLVCLDGANALDERGVGVVVGTPQGIWVQVGLVLHVAVSGFGFRVSGLGLVVTGPDSTCICCTHLCA